MGNRLVAAIYVSGRSHQVGAKCVHGYAISPFVEGVLQCLQSCAVLWANFKRRFDWREFSVRPSLDGQSGFEFTVLPGTAHSALRFEVLFLSAPRAKRVGDARLVLRNCVVDEGRPLGVVLQRCHASAIYLFAILSARLFAGVQVGKLLPKVSNFWGIIIDDVGIVGMTLGVVLVVGLGGIKSF